VSTGEKITSSRYRKKPVEVEAVQWTGENRVEVEAFLRDGESLSEGAGIWRGDELATFLPANLAYVIRNEGGGLRVVQANLFEATYEPVDQDGGEEQVGAGGQLREALEEIRKAFFRELEGRGFEGDEEIPSAEIEEALDAVFEQAVIDGRPDADACEMPERVEAALGALYSHAAHDENCGIPHPADPDQSSRCTCGVEAAWERANDAVHAALPSTQQAVPSTPGSTDLVGERDAAHAAVARQQHRADVERDRANELEDLLEGVEEFYGEALGLVRDLLVDAERIYEPGFKDPPHIASARDLADHEGILAKVRDAVAPTSESKGATRREQAVNELLNLAKLADDEQMRDQLESLASRFSLPPTGGSDRG